jgi:hypothetical protein
MAEDDGADHSAEVREDDDVGAARRGGVENFLEKIGKQIHGAVRKKHHEGHKDDEVGEALPMR